MLSSAAVRIDSSYVIDLRLLEMNHIKDFTFVHGEIRSFGNVLQYVQLGIISRWC
jgi:hypothetical protein